MSCRWAPFWPRRLRDPSVRERAGQAGRPSRKRTWPNWVQLIFRPCRPVPRRRRQWWVRTALAGVVAQRYPTLPTSGRGDDGTGSMPLSPNSLTRRRPGSRGLHPQRPGSPPSWRTRVSRSAERAGAARRARAAPRPRVPRTASASLARTAVVFQRGPANGWSWAVPNTVRRTTSISIVAKGSRYNGGPPPPNGNRRSARARPEEPVRPERRDGRGNSRRVAGSGGCWGRH